MMKNYNVTLNEELVDKVKIINKQSGRKFSTLLNNLLEEWLRKENK